MTNSVIKAPALKDGSDAASAKHLVKLFNDAQIGMRRIVALGLFAWEIKESKLKHGEFGPWLAAHCPKLTRPDSASGKPKASDALTSYMSLTRNVLENLGYTVEKYLAFISNSRHSGICQGGKFLLLPDKKVPEEVRPLKEKICAMVDGKTQRQLFFEFKQAEEDQSTGEVKPKRGRLKGQGGASKEQRAAAAAAEEEARIEALELETEQWASWVEQNCDDKNLGAIHEPCWQKLCGAQELLNAYIRRVTEARAAAKNA